MKINWKQKLSSRKFWVAVAGWVTSLLTAFNVTDNIIAQVLKPAEDGGGCVLRLYETAGRAVEATIDLPLLNRAFTVSLGRHEVKTLFIPSEGAVQETDFIERI